MRRMGLVFEFLRFGRLWRCKCIQSVAHGGDEDGDLVVDGSELVIQAD